LKKRTMSLIRRCPVPNIMLFGAVETGNVKAKHAPKLRGSNK